MTVPDLPPSRGDRSIAHLAKRCEDAATMGMFRIADSRFLLVYSGSSSSQVFLPLFLVELTRWRKQTSSSKSAGMVNRFRGRSQNGSRSRNRSLFAIPTSVRFPFLCPLPLPLLTALLTPPAVAISPTLIEIRNAFTGRLVRPTPFPLSPSPASSLTFPYVLQAQFITGSHMSLTYDGSAIPSLPSPSSAEDLRTPRPGDEKFGGGGDLAGPVDKRLHVSTRQGAFHVLHEVVVVA
jgi:hypothetical protein